MKLPRVVLVDDHRLMTDGLMRLLSSACDIVGVIDDGDRVIDAVEQLRPAIVILDLSMRRVSGLEAIRRLSEHGACCHVIVLTMHADPNMAVEVIKAGARGFVLKEASGEELLAAIDVVLAGGTYLATSLTKEIVTLMLASPAPEPGELQLTTRQRELLRLMMRGQRAKEIADVLNTSTRSVEAAKYRLMQTLQVHSTAELVRYAVEHRLVTL